MDILRYARSLRRHWRLLIVTTVVGLGLGVASAAAQPAQRTSSWYRAEHTLFCEGASPNLAQLAAFATTGPVPEKAAERLGESTAEMTAFVRARPVPEAGFLQIVAVGTDAAKAEETADTVAEELTAYELQLPDPTLAERLAQIDQEMNAQRDLWNQALANGANAADLEEAEFYKTQHDQAVERFNELEAERQELEQGGNRQACLSTVSSAEAVATNRDAVEELLTAPTAGKNGTTAGSGIPELQQQASTLGPVPRGAAGAAGGLLIGIAIGLVVDRIDPRIRTKDQAETAFGWPVIAEIPPLPKPLRSGDAIATYDQPRSRIAEAYRVLRSSILFAADVSESAFLAAGTRADAKEARPANGNGNGSTTNGSTTKATAEHEADPASDHSADEATSTDDDEPRRSRTVATAGRRARRNDDDRPDDDQPGEDAAEETSPPDATDDREAAPLTADVDAPVVQRDAVVVMITSPGPAEGKTTSVANLAAAFAEANAKVLVVNCDFRRPRVHAFLGGTETTSLAGPVASSYTNIDLFDHHTEDVTNSPAEILAEQRRIIRRCRTRYDVILLDTAPLLSTNDATEVLNEADLVVLVGRAGKTTKEAADRAAELLDRREAPVLGVTLVGVTEGPGGRYYYYGSNRYYSDETRRPDAASPLEEMARTDAGR